MYTSCSCANVGSLPSVSNCRNLVDVSSMSWICDANVSFTNNSRLNVLFPFKFFLLTHQPIHVILYIRKAPTPKWMPQFSPHTRGADPVCRQDRHFYFFRRFSTQARNANQAFSAPARRANAPITNEITSYTVIRLTPFLCTWTYIHVTKEGSHPVMSAFHNPILAQYRTSFNTFVLKLALQHRQENFSQKNQPCAHQMVCTGFSFTLRYKIGSDISETMVF